MSITTVRVGEFRQYSNYKIFIALGGMIALALVGTITAILAMTQMLQVREISQHHNDARFQMENLLTNLETAETSQRGYLLTGDPAYLTPYHQTTANASRQLQVLEQQSNGAPYHAGILQLQHLVQSRLAMLDQGITLYNAGDIEGSVASLKSGQESVISGRIRRSISGIEQAQASLLAQGRQRIESFAALARGVSLATLGLTLLLASLVYYLYVKAIQAERELDYAKDEFVSLASHQLRTPATGIKSILAMLVAGDLGPLGQQQKYFVSKALESNEREIRIIDELLNVARADAGRLVLRASELELGTLVATVIAEQRTSIESKKITLRFKPPARPIHLEADEEKLFMAVSNLLDNARKYTPEKGKITVVVHEKRGSAAVEVTDTGIGIDETEMSHIFDRFQRARNVLGGNIEGTGLGLYLARRIMELHNGNIEVSSKKDHGTKFVMTLPQRRT